MSILQKRSQRAGTGILYTGGKWTIDGATQANQEAETAGKVVTSDVQHFGPSAAKWWLYTEVSAGSPGFNTVSYNVTSITDDGPGLLTVTIATDYSSSSWCRFVNVFSAAALIANWDSTAAGTVQLTSLSRGAGAATDPAAWSAGGFGDQ